MPRYLIHPPFADPTQPYVSLPALAGYLRPKGLDVRLLDLNVEAARWLLARSTLRSLAARLERLYLELNRRRSLDFPAQRRYRAACEALPRIRLAAASDPGPIETFTTRELFHDAALYERARLHAESALAALSALHDPFRYGFNHAAHSTVPWSFDLLERHARAEGPLDALYRAVLDGGDADGCDDEGRPRVDLADAEFVGISVAFPSQVPEAFRLAAWARRLAPRAFVAFGGPAVHQVAVHLEPELKGRLLDLVDGVGLFEGEETLARLLPLLPEWQEARDARLLFDVPNLMLRDPVTGVARIGPRRTLDLRELPPPDPAGLDLDRYLAPSRTLLVAPTRGCYWNECSFCYYGLSETATASYREVPPERVAAQLARLSRRHGVTYFYVSCDVLAPAYAVRLAQALLDRGTDIRWSSDLKIEKYFTPERCEILARSGLKAAAFGIESGSDRILSLMRKGVDRATMTRVNRAFHDAGIATEWMTFTDHPGETRDEALATIRWIEEEREAVDLFIVGEFGLERGSAIYQDPGAFGVAKVWFAEGDELRLYAQFEEAGPGRSERDQERIDRAIARLSEGYRLSSYPWAGACSTHHTLLHFIAEGQGALKRNAGVGARVAGELAREARDARAVERPRFPLARIAEAEDEFLARYYRRALYTTLPARRGGPGVALAPLSLAHFEEAAKAVPEIEAGR